MITIKKNIKIYLILFLLLISIFTACEKGNNISNKKSITKYVDIYNVVQETFLTDKGYSTELSKHISEEVFTRTNLYTSYKSPDFGKPFSIDLNLKEDSQNSVNDIVYVKMIYSVTIMDSHNKLIGGSKDIPITFTVKPIKGDWYITEKEEPA